MAQLIDDNGVFCFVDDNGVSAFVDDLGNFLSCSPPSGLTSTTTVLSSLNPSTYLSAVTFTAVVSGAGGPPTGTVTFFDGASSIGAASLSGGTAALPYSALIVGSHAMSAVYGGDTAYNGSTSNTVTQVVNRASTTTALSSSLNPSTYLSAVTFTAVVSGPGGPPTGTVRFFNEGSSMGTVTLSGGTAPITTPGIASGVHIITAGYSGDGSFNASTSAQLDQLVTPPGSPWIAAARGRLWRRGIR